MKLSITITALFFIWGASTFAQHGDLDAELGSDGKVLTAFGTGDDRGNALAIQADGKLVVLGIATVGDYSDLALARYNSDGSLDLGFGVDGLVTTSVGTYNDEGRALVIQPDGKIVITGNVRNAFGAERLFGLVRYNTDGSTDASFGTNGIVTTDFGTANDMAMSLALQADGKIVVGGYAGAATTADFALARYNTDGALDPSFGVDGKVTTDIATNLDLGVALGIQADGKILLVGASKNGANYDIALARYNADGSLDTGFGAGGKVLTAIGTGDDEGRALAFQPDGKILVAGYAKSSQRDFALVRYNTDGSLDLGFGPGGHVTTDFGDYNEAQALALQSDGRIILCGTTWNGTSNDVALARYEQDGSLDPSFGVAGKVTTAFGTGSALGRAVALQTDGRIVIAGYAKNGLVNDFILARYLSGLNIGIVEFGLANAAPLIYPNPITTHATLEYTLREAETLSIHLLDMQGRRVRTFMEGQHQVAGRHQRVIEIPADLPAGAYLLAISSPTGRVTVQVVK